MNFLLRKYIIAQYGCLWLNLHFEDGAIDEAHCRAGRKVYAQGMGTEALSRILRWLCVAQADVQVCTMGKRAADSMITLPKKRELK